MMETRSKPQLAQLWCGHKSHAQGWGIGYDGSAPKQVWDDGQSRDGGCEYNLFL